MSEPRDSLESQTQDPGSQLHADDNFSEPSTIGSSSFFHDPSSYASHTVAYGTNIDISKVSEQARQFIQNYKPDDSNKPIYLQKLEEMNEIDEYNLNIDMTDVFKYSEEFYAQFIAFPVEMIAIMDAVAKEIYLSIYPTDRTANPDKIQVRPYNLKEIKTIRDLHPTDIDRLVSVKGMITRTSHIIPDLSEVAFRCRDCQHVVHIQVNNGKVQEMTQCPSCNRSGTLEIDHELSLFTDRQHIKLQESPESIPQGETPQTIGAIAFEELVDYARPGDRVVLTGIWRAMPARINPRVRTVHSVYRTYIDIVHIKKNLTNAIDNEECDGFDESNRTAQQLEQAAAEAEEMARDPEIYDKLVKSFAPSIWQMDEQKRGLLCLLFGGSTSAIGNRGDINILLVGDPATAKSQLIQYTNKVAPRGLYTSGKGSSAVGLTASVVRDPESGEFVLESGALVLSDRGVCCIDEFDKMSESARSVLHEVMEQQTVSVAKAGIVCSLNARAAIVACANPRDSAYNTKLSVVENIQLPPTLLSRFDLVYLVLDKIDRARDTQLARHIVGLYTTKEEVTAPYTTKQLTSFIAYAKEHCNPILTDAAQECLIDGYEEMRKIGGPNVVSATPRQLESCIRIAEANAKMRLAVEVEPSDVKVALDLMKQALHQSATDPTTGFIDMDLLNTGTSYEMRRIQSHVAKEIVKMLRLNNELSFTTICQNIRNVNPQYDERVVTDALLSLEADDTVFLTVENQRPVRASLIRRE